MKNVPERLSPFPLQLYTFVLVSVADIFFLFIFSFLCCCCCCCKFAMFESGHLWWAELIKIDHDKKVKEGRVREKETVKQTKQGQAE